MTMQIRPKETTKGNKNMYVPGLFDKPSLFTKITLKKPLSRGSRFKIYFRSERRGNRGSRLNFHGIPFRRPYINKTGSLRIMPFKDYMFIK